MIEIEQEIQRLKNERMDLAEKMAEKARFVQSLQGDLQNMEGELSRNKAVSEYLISRKEANDNLSTDIPTPQ